MARLFRFPLVDVFFVLVMVTDDSIIPVFVVLAVLLETLPCFLDFVDVSRGSFLVLDNGVICFVCFFSTFSTIGGSMDSTELQLSRDVLVAAERAFFIRANCSGQDRFFNVTLSLA